MVPKRAAKKAAPPPPPLPPAESSDDESEDEEAIADSPVPAVTHTLDSPVPAVTHTLRNKPALSQTGGESESSEEDGDEDDEEDEDEPVRAPPNNQAPPPHKEEDSDTSGSDDSDEEEEEPAPKKQPPPAPEKNEESDGSADDEEDDEEEPTRDAPPSVPKKDLKPPAAVAETKKRGAFQRIWSTGDEVRILEALAAHQKQHGALPQPETLVAVLAGKLDNPAYGSKELQSKVTKLRTRYLTLSKRGDLPSNEHDRRLLDLSKIVWDSDKTTPAAVAAATDVVNGHEHKGFEEMCELYPFLAEEVKGLEAAHPGMCKREFGKINGDKARAMDEKIKRQRVVQIKLEMRGADLAKEVTKALCDLVDG